MVIRKDSTFCGIWHEFTQNTNMHGMGAIGRSYSSPVRSTIWAILAIVGTVFLTINVVNVVNRYIERDVTTDVSIQFRKELVFPAVTICNLNPVRKHILDGLAEYDYITWSLYMIKQEIFNLSSNPFAMTMDPSFTGNPLPPPTKPVITTASSTTKQSAVAAGRRKRQVPMDMGPGPLQQVSSPSPDAVQTVPPEEFVSNNGSEWAPEDWDESYWEQIDDESDAMWEVEYLRREFIETLAMADMRVAKFLGHQKDTMIVDCIFDEKICTPKNFTWSWNYKYGNCYTFNAGWNASQHLRSVGTSGPLHGLTLELFIEETQYTEEITQDNGMKVVIHAADRMPFPEDEGFQLAPGFKTSIGVRMVNITRAEYPLKTNCEKGHGAPNAYITYSRPNVSYTNQICMKTCKQIKTIEECHCANVEFPYLSPVFLPIKLTNGEIWGNVDQRVCDSTDLNDSLCLEDLKELLRTNMSMACRCYATCNDVIFSARNSMSKWPSKNYADMLMTKLMMRSPFWENQLNDLQGAEDSNTQARVKRQAPGFGSQPPFKAGSAQQPDSRPSPSMQNFGGGGPQPAKGGSQGGAYPKGGTNPPPPKEPMNDQQQRLIERNMLKLEVYYEDLNYELISESEAYGITSLISDIGGNMGMWVGLSAIALCEFIELFIDIFFFLITGGSLTRRNKINSVEMTKH